VTRRCWPLCGPARAALLTGLYSFNHRSIMDCFQSVDKDSVALHFHGEGKPLVMKAIGD
jgi:hypothetical protein